MKEGGRRKKAGEEGRKRGNVIREREKRGETGAGTITSRLRCETASRLMKDDCCVAVILWGRDSRGVMERKGRRRQ